MLFNSKLMAILLLFAGKVLQCGHGSPLGNVAPGVQLPNLVHSHLPGLVFAVAGESKICKLSAGRTEIGALAPRLGGAARHIGALRAPAHRESNRDDIPFIAPGATGSDSVIGHVQHLMRISANRRHGPG